MKFYHLTFFSKNRKSLTNSFLFLTNTLNLNFNVVKKYCQKKTKKHFLTILKSPHVNKSAQEQFDSQIFSKQLTLSLTKKHEQIYFLKKVQNNLFNGTKIKIKCLSNKEKKKAAQLDLFNPNNFAISITKFDEPQNVSFLKVTTKVFKQNTKKIKLFLKTLDTYGELVGKIRLDSSVGRARD